MPLWLLLSALQESALIPFRNAEFAQVAQTPVKGVGFHTGMLSSQSRDHTSTSCKQESHIMPIYHPARVTHHCTGCQLGRNGLKPVMHSKASVPKLQ